MSQTAILTLARLHGGHIEAARPGMLLFSFTHETSAVSFANVSGGMLIRGLVRGAVDVAVEVK